MTKSHTPTPWIFNRGSNGQRYIGTEGSKEFNKIVSVSAIYSGSTERAESNAAFIVRACNSHDNLITALERLIDFFVEDNEKSDHMAVQNAYESLAKAKGEV